MINKLIVPHINIKIYLYNHHSLIHLINTFIISIMMQKRHKPFFETQTTFSLQCGVHCVNNLLGQHTYDEDQMVNICKDLSDDFINPHKFIFGGDYDANVIIVALQRKGYDVEWHDSRKEYSTRNDLDILGFIFNIQQKKRFYHKILGISSRHWVSLKLNVKSFYLFDSLEKELKKIGNETQTISYINKLLKEQSELLIVYKPKNL